MSIPHIKYNPEVSLGILIQLAVIIGTIVTVYSTVKSDMILMRRDITELKKELEEANLTINAQNIILIDLQKTVVRLSVLLEERKK